MSQTSGSSSVSPVDCYSKTSLKLFSIASCKTKSYLSFCGLQGHPCVVSTTITIVCHSSAHSLCSSCITQLCQVYSCLYNKDFLEYHPPSDLKGISFLQVCWVLPSGLRFMTQWSLHLRTWLLILSVFMLLVYLIGKHLRVSEMYFYCPIFLGIER